MLKTLTSSISWLYILGRKLFRVAPFETISVVLIQLFSQVATIVVSVLPLQIIIVLGAGKIPRFLPKQLSLFEIDTVIVGLSALTAIFSILKFIAEKIGENQARQGAEKLQSASHKTVVFRNQDELASNSYKNYTEALAGAFFCGSALIVIGILYPNAAIFLIIGITISLAILLISCGLRESIREHVKEGLPALIKPATTFLFFYILIFIIIEFLYFSPPKFIFAIITIILIRQVFGQISKTIRGIFKLLRNKEKINALFFHDKIYNPDHFALKNTTWDLLKAHHKNRWIQDIFLEVFSKTTTKFDIKWQQANIKDLVCIKALDLESKHHLLIKLYSKSQASLARHEATLLMDSNLLLPAPPFVLATTINDFHYNVFDITRAIDTDSITKITAGKAIRERLLAVEPPVDLVERYTRSKPMLWRRANERVIRRLRLVADREDMPLIKQYNKLLPMIISLLKNLPLAFNLSKIDENFLYHGEEKNLLYAHWGNWGLEPIGAGWSIKTNQLAELSNIVNSASKSRASLSGIPATDYELAALIYAIDSKANQQRYKDAISLLPSLFERLRT